MEYNTNEVVCPLICFNTTCGCKTWGFPRPSPPCCHNDDRRAHIVLVNTKKKPTLYQKNLPFGTKNPPFVLKNSPTDLAGMDPRQNQYAPTQNHLASPRILHLRTLMYQKDNLGAPFCMKTTLGWVFSGQSEYLLSATFYNF